MASIFMFSSTEGTMDNFYLMTDIVWQVEITAFIAKNVGHTSETNGLGGERVLQKHKIPCNLEQTKKTLV